MKRARGALAAVLVVMAAASACGDGSSDERAETADATAPDGAGDTTSTTGAGGANAAGGTTTTASGRSKAGATSGANSAGATSGSGATEGGAGDDGEGLPSEPLPMSVVLSSKCVRRGTPMTVTIRSEQNAAVGYDTTWADGKNGMEKHGYGGTGNGRIDESGEWKSTFTVGPNAPEGEARLEAIGTAITGQFGRATAEFAVSDALGKCS